MSDILDFIISGGVVSIIVFIWLSLYFIFTFWIYISRYLILTSWERVEEESLSMLLQDGGNIKKNSALSKCIKGSNTHRLLPVCKALAEERATKYLSALSIISSTSPFIGLFGTVVAILSTFSNLNSAKSASLAVIAPAISEALVATALGILVAIPAYSVHLILKRKAYKYLNLIQREIDVLNVKTYYD
jgi:biopolymer transport protein ExbB/TolQ